MNIDFVSIDDSISLPISRCLLLKNSDFIFTTTSLNKKELSYILKKNGLFLGNNKIDFDGDLEICCEYVLKNETNFVVYFIKYIVTIINGEVSSLKEVSFEEYFIRRCFFDLKSFKLTLYCPKFIMFFSRKFGFSIQSLETEFSFSNKDFIFKILGFGFSLKNEICCWRKGESKKRALLQNI